MSGFNLFKILIVVFLATTCASLENQQVFLFTDGSCKNPLNNFNYKGYESWAPTFTMVEGASDNSYASYNNLQFGRAGAPLNQPGYGIYWDIGTIDLGCRVIFMKLTIERKYGQLDPNQAPGKVILNVGSQGCYYTSLPIKFTLIMTFCYGIGDCTRFASGNQAPYTRQALMDKRLLITDRDMKSEKTDCPRGGSFTSRASALAALIKYLTKRDTCSPTDNDCFAENWDSCQISVEDSSPSAGLQVATSPSQPCPVIPDGYPTCSSASSIGFTSGVSLSTSSTTTTTKTPGDTIYMVAGVKWPVKATVTNAVSFELANSISNSASKELSNSTTVTVTKTLGIVPSTTAFLTFTPSYTCYIPDIDCTDTPNVSNPDEFASLCFLILNADGQPQGEAKLVYIG